jgi:hypothetical protein
MREDSKNLETDPICLFRFPLMDFPDGGSLPSMAFSWVMGWLHVCAYWAARLIAQIATGTFSYRTNLRVCLGEGPPWRLPAIRAVDRLASANLRRLRMNGLRPVIATVERPFIKIVDVDCHQKGESTFQLCRFCGVLEGKSCPVTCRKGSGACRCSVAVQNH